MICYELFHECLKRTLEEANISASEAARLVGYRSRNSIFRILLGQTSIRIMEEFLDTFRAKNPKLFTPQRWSELHEALEVSRLGVKDYLASRAIRQLIQTRGSDAPEVLLTICEADGTLTTEPFCRTLREFASFSRIELAICGCCDAGLFRTLSAELSHAGTAGRVYVRHYVSVSDNEAVQNIVAIQPLLYKRWYDPYLVEPGCCTEEMASLYRAGMVFAVLTDEAGSKQHRLFMLHDRGKLFCAAYASAGVEDYIRLMNLYTPGMSPLKRDFGVNANAEDYLSYTQQYAQMEANRDVYSIKPDVPINYIHPDVLVPSVIDGFREMGFTQESGMSPLVQQFYDVHMSRYQNMVTKRKVTYAVFSLEAMEKFIRTGKTSDHFFAMRPYTLAERLAILRQLRDEDACNPFFTIRFLKEEVLSPAMEITLYDGRGVLFTNANTDYDLSSGDHTEALVEHPGFANQFREFFLKELLAKYAMSHQESLAAMDGLIRLAASQA